MNFLLQKELNKDMDVDTLLIKNLLNQQHLLHQYLYYTLSDFYNVDENGNILKDEVLPKENHLEFYHNAIPVGTIPFVELCMKVFHNIPQINPIEIPPCLQKEEFLKRRYSIVQGKDIPTSGRYFIKDVSHLKVFSYDGDMEYFMYDGIFDEPKLNDTRIHLKKDNLYQVSDILNVLSEYRVVFLDGKLDSISHYNGDVTLFPDVDLLLKANEIYSMQKDYPKSYTMDVMITPEGTSIIEIHILFSTGIYTTLLGTNYLYGLKDAYDYTLNYNTPIKVTSK